MTKLSKEEVLQIMKGKKTQSIIQANKVAAEAQRESDLMLLGYNQALLDYGQLPESWTREDMAKTIDEQKQKLGLS